MGPETGGPRPNYDEIILTATHTAQSPCAETLACDKKCGQFDMCTLRTHAKQQGFTKVQAAFSKFIDYQMFCYVRDPQSTERVVYNKELTEIDIARAENLQVPHRFISQMEGTTYRSEFSADQQKYVHQALDFIMQQKNIADMQLLYQKYIQQGLEENNMDLLEERAYIYAMQGGITNIFNEQPQLMPAVTAVFTTFGTSGMSLAMEKYLRNRGENQTVQLSHSHFTTFFNTNQLIEARHKKQRYEEGEYAVTCPFGIFGKASIRIMEKSALSEMPPLTEDELNLRQAAFKRMLIEVPRHSLALTHLLITAQDGTDSYAETVNSIRAEETIPELENLFLS